MPQTQVFLYCSSLPELIRWTSSARPTNKSEINTFKWCPQWTGFCCVGYCLLSPRRFYRENFNKICQLIQKCLCHRFVFFFFSSHTHIVILFVIIKVILHRVKRGSLIYNVYETQNFSITCKSLHLNILNIYIYFFNNE